MASQNPADGIRNALAEPLVRYIQEPAARPLVYAFKETPVTPNQVTILSALLAIWAAYLFSLGEARTMIQGGIIFELSLILDSVDGELARAKGMASDWGRIVDGIGDYVSSVAVLIGLMIGLPDSQGALLFMAFMIFLRGVSFDYFKESMTSRIKHGYDGPQRDIHKTYEKISRSPSWVLKLYFYYLQFQQVLFRGVWTSLNRYPATRENQTAEVLWPEQQRWNYYREKKGLIALWKWNGPDLIFILMALLSCFTILDKCIYWLSAFMLLQMLATFTLHHYLIRNEKYS